MFDVTALGELLIDFSQSEALNQSEKCFIANPGGAPANVLAMLTRLGKSTAFIGKVGKDSFGDMLAKTLKEKGIDTNGLVYDAAVHTTLAFVENDETGERSFTFYRNPGADMMLNEQELNRVILCSTRIFHFGTLSMTDSPAREATLTAITVAKENGALISFDPNIRPALWRTIDEARTQMLVGCGLCDILKIEAGELKLLTGCENEAAGVAELQSKNKIKMILVTSGEGGSTAYFGDESVHVPALITPKTVDTTGAGDTFFGCCLSYILDNQLDGMNKAKMLEMLRFANAAASIVTTRIGAINSMPSPSEINALI